MDKPKKVELISDKPIKRKSKSEPIYLDTDPSDDFLPVMTKVPVKPVTRRSTRLNVSSSQDITNLPQSTNLSVEEMNTSQETNTPQQNSIPETEELKGKSSILFFKIVWASLTYLIYIYIHI